MLVFPWWKTNFSCGFPLGWDWRHSRLTQNITKSSLHNRCITCHLKQKLPSLKLRVSIFLTFRANSPTPHPQFHSHSLSRKDEERLTSFYKRIHQCNKSTMLDFYLGKNPQMSIYIFWWLQYVYRKIILCGRWRKDEYISSRAT